MIDNKTQRLSLPLPNVDNYLEDDVVRLSEALEILDAKVATVGDDGKIQVEQLPAIALTDTFPVASQEEMLSLNAQPGDVAIRSDVSKSFILMTAPSSVLANWKELLNNGFNQVKDALSQVSGSLTGTPEETPVPSHSNPDLGPAMNAQAQALLNRIEWLKGIFDGPNDNGLTGFYAGDGWSGSDASEFNIYNTTGSIHTNATRQRFKLTESEASADPTIWLDKYTSVSRDDGVNRWDNGNIYAALHKKSGGAYGASITGVGRHLGGNGDLIGIHGRGYGYHGNAKVWGGWFYSAAMPGGDSENVIDLIGIEINLNNKRGDVSWTPADGKGLYRGLIVNTADGSGTAHIGIDVGRQISTSSKGWYVGYRVRADSIIAFDQSEGEKAAGILIEGASSLANRYGGLCFRGGNFHYGIDMTGIDTIDNNAAIVLKDGHRIKWGSRTSSRYIDGNSANGVVNFTNYAIAINGNKVLGDQQPAIANAVAGTEITTINALLNTLRNHGLIAK